MKRRRFCRSLAGTSLGIPLMSHKSIDMFASNQTSKSNPKADVKPSLNIFDVIVIGVGSMGAATCYYLAQRGYKVLGLEQFSISHQLGSHSGQSRIIRKAYFEHPDYVPLLLRAYDNWRAIEAATTTQLYHPIGFVYFGPPEHALLEGVKRSAGLYDLPLEYFDQQAALKRFPQFRSPEDYEIILEPEAGFISPEKAILTFAEEAIKLGADLRTNEKVIEWKQTDGSIKVTTQGGTYQSKKLVITAGPWSGNLIPGLTDHLQVTRQLLAWVKPKKWQDFTLGNLPCWTVAHREKPGIYYGFPILPAATFSGPIGLKVAYHHPGTPADPDGPKSFDTEAEIKDLKEILDQYIPEALDSLLEVKSCFYTNTPDAHFIIDRLPGYEDTVSVACGFSGHGFKFVPVVGEAMADLAIEGKTDLPIEFLNAKRFS